MNELVSILIPAYNCERYIASSIESCLKQDYSNFEICIVDDGSTDKTWEVIESYSNIRDNISTFRFPKNLGKVSALNKCYELSKGYYFALHAADDLMKSDRISVSINSISGYEMLSGDAETFNSTGILSKEYIGIKNEFSSNFKEVLLNPYVLGGTIFFSKKAAYLVFPINELFKHEDWWIPTVIASEYKIIFIPKILTSYRTHLNQSSNNLKSYKYWKEYQGREIEYYKHVLNNFKLDNETKLIISLRIKYQEIFQSKNIVKKFLNFIALKRNKDIIDEDSILSNSNNSRIILAVLSTLLYYYLLKLFKYIKV